MDYEQAQWVHVSVHGLTADELTGSQKRVLKPHPTLVPTSVEDIWGAGGRNGRQLRSRRQEQEAAEEPESLKGEKQLGRNNQNALGSEERRVWPSGDAWTWMI